MKTLAVSFVLAACAFGQPSSNSPLAPPTNGPRRVDPAWFALVNCTVHVRAGAEPMEAATVIIRDGVIIGVLPGQVDESAPAKANGKTALKPARTPIGPRVIECDGLHIYPGWIDAYVEVDAPAPRGDESTLHWNSRVTPQRRALDGAGIEESAANDLRKLGFTAAAISPKGGIFRGSASVVSLAKGPEDASAPKVPVYAHDVYQSVAMETGGGGGGGGGGGTAALWGSYPDSQMGAIALIRQTFEDAKWQHKQRESNISKDGSDAADGGALTALAPQRNLTTQDRPRFLFDSANELDLYRIGAIVSEQSGEAYPIPTMVLGSGFEFRRLGALKDAMQQPLRLVLPLTFAKAPDVSTPGKQEGVDLRDMMTWEQGPTNPRRIAKAGIEFSLTTAKLRDRGEFLKNLRTAITYGLDEKEALTALTLRPAGWLGVGEQLGALEAGKIANIIVTDGPIFGKVTAGVDESAESGAGAQSKVRGVWIDGIWHAVTPVPVIAQGTWDVMVTGSDDGIARTLVIDRDNGATVTRAGKEVKATRVSVEEGRLTFTFDHDVLEGSKGIFTMAAVLETAPTRIERTPVDAAEKPVAISFAPKLTGIGVSGDGKRFEWTAVQRPRSLAGVWPVRFEDPAIDAPVLVVDKDGKLHAAADGENTPAAALVIQEVAYDGTTLTYKVDHSTPDAPGGKVVVDVKSTVDWSAKPPVLRGAVTTPEGKSWPWTATRRAANPFVGTWKVTKADGKEMDGEGLTLAIKGDSVTLTFKGKEITEQKPREPGAVAADAKSKDTPIVIKADDVKFMLGTPAGEPKKPSPIELTFTHDVRPLMGKGKDAPENKSTDKVTITFTDSDPANDVITGTSTLTDGSTHTYTAVRSTRAKKPAKEPTKAEAGAGAEAGTGEPDKTQAGKVEDGKGVASESEGKSDADEEMPTDIPEELPLPFGAYGTLTYPEPAEHTIISNVTIWTCADEGIITKGYVYLKGGKIAQVGEGEPMIAVPQGERSSYINGGGKHLTPGIIDCHSHTGISGGVNESGQSVTAEARIADVTNPDAIGWYQQLAGGVTTVNNLHGSANSIGGQSQTNKLRWGSAKPNDMHFEGAAPGIKFALGENPRRANGSGASARYPNTRMGVEMQIRDRFTAAREYARDVKAGKARRDLELEALAEVLDGTRLVHCHSYRQDEMLMLAMMAKEFNFRIGTYQHALEGYKVADYVRDYSGGASGFADWWAYKVEVQDAIPAAFSIMHEQGAVASFNSDSNELARRMNTEAAKAVKYGDTPPEEALKFVTLFPAKQLKIDERVGSIEVGKDADLALWSGPPLSGFSRCEMTFVDGRKLFSLEEDAVMRERIATERTRLIQKLLADKKKRGEKPGKDGDASGTPSERPAGRRGPRPTTLEEAKAQEEEAQQAREIQEAFYQMYTSGKFRHTQGICGCGITHNYAP
jgi:imidazolonepropionase-like amidohydrolase